MARRGRYGRWGLVRCSAAGICAARWGEMRLGTAGEERSGEAPLGEAGRGQVGTGRYAAGVERTAREGQARHGTAGVDWKDTDRRGREWRGRRGAAGVEATAWSGTATLAPGQYSAVRIDPRDGTRTELGTTVGETVNFSLPPGDWVLIYTALRMP